MINDAYWIAVQAIFGVGSSRAIEVLEKFGDVKAFFDADENEIRSAHIMTPAELGKFKNYDFAKSDKIVKTCAEKGYKILTPDDDEFPPKLLRIKNPPVVLYVDGTLPDMEDEVGICMVGTRNCTKNGLIVASVLGYRLAEAGSVIISGGALGIDTACSRGAVAANKKSIIVLGCGLEYPYLLNNRKIRDDVRKNGAVITEYPPDFAPSISTFPIRNRLMSALSNGVVVIEAPEKSGSLITVSHALEQGKDIYVVPGDITNKNYAGNNKLLKDGAEAIYTPRDVLDTYMSSFPHKLDFKNADIPLNEDRMYINMYNKNRNVSEIDPLGVKKRYERQTDNGNDNNMNIAAEPVHKYNSDRAVKKPETKPKKRPLDFEHDETVEKIYNCFTNEPQSVDILIQKSGVNAGDVLYALTELEINGMVESLPGGSYKLI